jgi:hypothetical protein
MPGKPAHGAVPDPLRDKGDVVFRRRRGLVETHAGAATLGELGGLAEDATYVYWTTSASFAGSSRT